MRCRKTGPEDLPQLRQIWALAFDDGPEGDEDFFRTCLQEAIGFAAEEDGQLLSALYALPQTLVCGEQTRSAAYLFAVATRPERRGQGIGAKLLAYAERELRKRYVSFVWLVPADGRLRAYYARLGYVPGPCAQERELPAPRGRGACDAVGAQEYAGMRETLLLDAPHIRCSLAQLRYQACTDRFFALTLDGRYGCASARAEDGVIRVTEILPDASMLPALMQGLPGRVCRVRTAGPGSPLGMVRQLDGAEPVPAFYAPFVFDE